ncbi:MAG: ROK family protein [Ignavibacteriae bacterium HGW-Ignavibacteriae-3]|nr:MAG: ROK family protein [Ignavibacteriae bacterium HGW-Ignavibacteriae-3]
MTERYIVAVDLGGTKILSALIDSKNEIIARLKISTVATKGAEHLVSSIAESVKKLLSENNLEEDSIRAVCLGVPGTVNPYTGLIGNAPNLNIKDFNIKDALAKEITIPVLIENDVNLAGLGIMKFEMGADVKNMLVVFVGTGIGGALFFDGKLYRGSSFFAGEIGHMIVEPKGEFSTSSNRATFELTASRTAIVREIKRGLDKGKKSVLKEYASPKKQLKSKTLADAVRKEDPLASKYAGRAASAIGTVLGSITTLLNIDTIVLGGGVIEAMSDFMLPRIEKSFKESVLKEPGGFVKIFDTKLGDDAALYGGVALAEEFLP